MWCKDNSTLFYNLESKQNAMNSQRSLRSRSHVAGKVDLKAASALAIASPTPSSWLPFACMLSKWLRNCDKRGARFSSDSSNTWCLLRPFASPILSALSSWRAEAAVPWSNGCVYPLLVLGTWKYRGRHTAFARFFCCWRSDLAFFSRPAKSLRLRSMRSSSRSISSSNSFTESSAGNCSASNLR